MPNVIKNSFSESANHVEVIWQRGKPIIDFELNEAQRIVRVNFARLLEDAVQKVYGDATGYTPGSSDDGLKATPNGANSVMFAAGSVIFKGERVRHPGGAFSIAPTYAGVGTTTYCVYAKVEEVEIVDPNALDNLGETTRRMKLNTTLMLSTTGIGGVPVSSSLDTWDGGIKYYPICTVLRRTGDTTVVTNDITDLRKMLPSSVVHKIHRQENFAVKAVVAQQVETSADYMTLVANATDEVLEIDTGFFFSVNAGPNGPTGGTFEPERQIAKVFAGLLAGVAGFGRIHALSGSLGSGVFGTDSGSVRFEDGNTFANPHYNWIDMTSSGNGEVRLFEERPIEYDVGVTYSGPRAIIETLNGRWTATVGDGEASRGDFTGQGALDGAVRYFIDNIFAGSNTQVCHLLVKSGAYIFSDTLDIPEGMTLLLEATQPGAGACSFSAEGATLVAAVSVATEARLVMRGLEMITSGSDASRLAILSNGDLEFDDCHIDGRILILNVEVPNDATTPLRFAGLRARRCVFKATQGVSSDLSNCITIGSSPVAGSLYGKKRMAFTFEDCRFIASTRGTILSLTSTSTTPSSMGKIHFKRCMFAVSPTPTSTSPAGILGASAEDTYAGFTRADQVIFEQCGVTEQTSAVEQIVFDLCASNATGIAQGVVIEELIMRDCDWRVPCSPTRVYAPWHFGESLVANELGVGIAPFWSIKSMTVSNTKFGYVENSLFTFGENINGRHRSLADGSDYSAALGFHAKNLTLQGVTFDNASQFCKTADVFFSGCGQVNVDGLDVIMTNAGDVAVDLPKFRVIHYPAPSTSDISGRDSFGRRMANFTFRSSGASGSCATDAILELVPGGQFLLDNVGIYGRDGDVAIRTDARLGLTYSAWDYSGLTIRGGRIHNAYRGYYLAGPGSGDVDHLFDYTIEGVKFSDIYGDIFLVNTPDPAGNAAYFCTVTNFLVTKCSHRYVDRDASSSVQCTFYVGRRASPTDGEPLNLRMTDNDFGNRGIVHLGANATISPIGLYYLIMGNRFDVFMRVIVSITNTQGLHTGYNTLATSMNAYRSFVDAEFMVQNYGLYYDTLPP